MLIYLPFHTHYTTLLNRATVPNTMTILSRNTTLFVAVLVILIAGTVIFAVERKEQKGELKVINTDTSTTTPSDTDKSTFLNSTEKVVQLTEQYVATTHYPDKGPSGLVLRVLDARSMVPLRVNTLFSDLPDNAEFVSQDVLLPPQNTSPTILLSFRTQPFAPDFEPEEFEGFPGNSLTILNFATMETSTVEAPDPTTAFIPITYSTDGGHILLSNFLLVTVDKSGQETCWQQQVPCVKCVQQQGYSVLSIDEMMLSNLQSGDALRQWQDAHSVMFNKENMQLPSYQTCSGLDAG